jgi:hypothetical protein
MRAWKLLAGLLLWMSCTAAFCADSPIAPDQRRGVEQTFLTYPEWFLVHSPAEYARYVAAHPPHEFPFFGHIGQLWSGYASVTGEQMRAHYPANIGYHVMICVIASSTTIEYTLRAAYENTIGRASWLTSDGLTEEDRYGATVAQDYVDFIRREPWYLYDFGAKLKGLWLSIPPFGPNMIRKWERRYALSTEYLIKAGYAKLIEAATRAAYTPALMTTQVVVEHAPAILPAGVKVVRQLADGRAVMDLPRYYNFRIAVTQLAQGGGRVVDVAGNTSVILVTAWAPENTALKVDNARVLFRQPLLTMPGQERVGVVLPVSQLSTFVLDAPRLGMTVEHVYDY